MHLVLVFLWHLATCLRTTVLAGDVSTTAEWPPIYNQAVDDGSFGYYPRRTYATEPRLASPQANYLQYSSKCEDGLYTFITPRGWALNKPGPMILDGHGDLIWAHHFDNKFGGQAYDFMTQQYKGEDYLTFWLGDDRVRGHGSGNYYLVGPETCLPLGVVQGVLTYSQLNSSYDIVHKVNAVGGLFADLHEFLITPEGTALMTMYQIVPFDVTEFRDFDPNNPEDQHPNHIWDCVFQEVDIESGNLVFEWRASDHIPLNRTYHNIGLGGTRNDPFDWFHINSIAKDELGNYLISARYTHSITYIDGKTGDVIWTLGGRGNQFMDLSDGYALNFAWQHDARFLPPDTFPNMYTPPEERPGFKTQLLSFFDNGAEDQHYEWGLSYSRGLILEITYPIDDTQHFAQSTESDLVRREIDDVNFDFDAYASEYTRPKLNLYKVWAINQTNPDYTVRVIKAYENPQRVRSSSQGSVQILPQDGRDPKVLVGFGLNAVWTEYEADGTVLCDVHYGSQTSWERGDIQSYRTYKFPWTGRPEKPPKVDISDDDAEIYVSWNGATDVVDWILQCSEHNTKHEQAWADINRVAKNGFETIITIPENSIGDARFLRVIAVAESGRRLDYGTSEIIDRGLMAAYFPLINDNLPAKVAHWTPLKAFMVIVSVFSGSFMLYELSRRYLSWRLGRPGGGPLRWKNGPAYRLLSDSSSFSA